MDSNYNAHTVESNPDGGVNAVRALDPDKCHGCRYDGESSSDGSVTQLWMNAQVRTYPGGARLIYLISHDLPEERHPGNVTGEAACRGTC